MAKRILWMSRHTPSRSQVESLRSAYGADVDIVQDPNPFDSAETIARRYQGGGFDDMVVVCPLSVLERLCQMGIRPLWSESAPESDPRKIEFRGARGAGFRFVRFRRVKGVRVEFEDE